MRKFTIHRSPFAIPLLALFFLLAPDTCSLTPGLLAQEILVSTPIHSQYYGASLPLFRLTPGGGQVGNEQEWLNQAGIVTTYVDANGVFHPLSGGGITSINGLVAFDQFLVVCSTGLDFTIQDSVDTHSFCIPDASATARGLVTTGAQVFGGDKSFLGDVDVSSLTITGPDIVLAVDELDCSTVTPTPGVDIMCADHTAHAMQLSNNGGAFSDVLTSSSASSKWNALTAPDGPLALDMAGYASTFTNNRFTLSPPAVSLSAVTFTGAGLNDLTTSGTPAFQYDLHTCVKIDATGIPDTFEWGTSDATCSNGATGVAITGGAQLLAAGISVTFAHTTGHTLGNSWAYDISAPLSLVVPSSSSYRQVVIGRMAGFDPYLGLFGTTPLLFSTNGKISYDTTDYSYSSTSGITLTGSTTEYLNFATVGLGDIAFRTNSQLRMRVLAAGGIVSSELFTAPRFKSSGTALVAGDFVASGGWGNAASVAVTSASSDQSFHITVTSAGAGQGLNPTVAFTFHDGTWTAIPIYGCSMETGGTGALSFFTPDNTSATVLTLSYAGTPIAGLTYEVGCNAWGH